MKRQLLLIALLLVTGAVIAQTQDEIITADGNNVKEKRTIKTYSSLSVNGPFEVFVTDSNDSFVTLEGSQNIISLIEVSVEDGILTIQLPKNKKFKPHRKNKVYIKVPYSTSLGAVRLNGPGSIVCRKTIKSNIIVKLEGSGVIKLDLYSAKCEACMLGSGKIALKGSVQDFKCKIIGSGSIQAEHLETSNADVALTGSGNAYLACTKTIKGNISGSGNVAFTGEPASQDLKRTGSGDYLAY